MITQQSLHQFFKLCDCFRRNSLAGRDLQSAWCEAVRRVSDEYGVRYQTIGDIVRRLGLRNVDELREMLSAWNRGNSSPLRQQMKMHTPPAMHHEIDVFFSNKRPDSEEGVDDKVAEPVREKLSFNLPLKDARLLKGLAEMEGVPPGDLVADIVAKAVRSRIDAFLKKS